MHHLTLFLIAVLLTACSGSGQATDGTPEETADERTGSISGRLDHPMLQRWPAAVYLDDIGPSAGPSGAIAEVEPQHAVMDQKNLRFTPHILTVTEGTTIDFPNSDETRHNVYTSNNSACTFELGIYDPGVVKHVTCDTPGVITLMCNVHAEMRGFIIVTPTPYSATTDREGTFELTDVPAGRHSLTFFHERLEADTIEVQVVPDSTVQYNFNDLKRKRRRP